LAFSFSFSYFSYSEISYSPYCCATGGSFCSWGVLVRPTSPLQHYEPAFIYVLISGRRGSYCNYLSYLCNVVSLIHFPFPIYWPDTGVCGENNKIKIKIKSKNRRGEERDSFFSPCTSFNCLPILCCSSNASRPPASL
jgi:hypothetical protein